MESTFARQYADFENWHWWFRGRQTILESILRHELSPQIKRSLLSVGCGPSEGLGWLKPFAGDEGKIVGLDIDPSYGRNPSNEVAFVNGLLDRTPFTDHCFDAVLALDVLEHLDRDRDGLLEAMRLVKPGGLLVLTVPALPALWGIQDVVSGHRRRYTKRSLTNLFESAGLSNYRINYFNTLLCPPIALIRLFRRMRGPHTPLRSDFEKNRPGLANEVLKWVFELEARFVNYARLPIGISLVA